MKKNMVLPLLIVGLAFAQAGCAYKAQQTTKLDSLFQPTASVKEIMTSIVDTNADDVWNPVATIITKDGIEEKAPHTDEEWNEVRRHAVTLAEAGNLLMIQGRKVAAPGASTSDVPAELSASEIQKTIDAAPQDFIVRAQVFHAAVQEAINAIDAKNPEQLVRAGGRIDQACEECHLQFWYPLKLNSLSAK